MSAKKQPLELTEEDRKILDELKFWTRVARYICVGLLGVVGYVCAHISKEFMVSVMREIVK